MPTLNKNPGVSGWYPLVSGSSPGKALWRYPDLGSAFGSNRAQVFGYVSLWAYGFGHKPGLVVPGRVQSIGVGPGRRGLVGAAQLDARIPRVRACVGIAQVVVQKKN